MTQTEVAVAKQATVKVVRPDLARQHKTVSNRIQDTVETVRFKAEINLKDLDEKMDEHLVVAKEHGSLSFSKDDVATTESDIIVTGATEESRVQIDHVVLFEAVKALEQSKNTEKELKFANHQLSARYSDDKEM